MEVIDRQLTLQFACAERSASSAPASTWEGETLFVRHGTVADIPAGSALEQAYGGAGNLRSLTAAE